ncbi:integrin alpha FG-GAP repeat-containing protein 2 [Lunasporangiospora selenospora]|uniref:Integrin alpha FG-GAP repeat-containing protein 2 n=1 Tax=Lunasporangiospora selenospora TaxID=979761 RepID=A0A9P6G2T2_9FUNG|nr:integrin alpha FG-GAP repeat-containing protein 2 [Lunasporangiospora selenospora]
MPSTRHVSLVQKLRWHVSGNISPSAFAIGDIDGFGDNAFVIGNLVGELFIFKHNNPEGLPWLSCKGLGTITAIAIGDIRNCGKNSIVVLSAEGLCHIFDIANGLEEDPGSFMASSLSGVNMSPAPGFTGTGQTPSIYSLTPTQGYSLQQQQQHGHLHPFNNSLHGQNASPLHPNLPATPSIRPVPDIHRPHHHHSHSHGHSSHYHGSHQGSTHLNHGTPTIPQQNAPNAATTSTGYYHAHNNAPSATPIHASHATFISQGVRRGSDILVGSGSARTTTAVLANLIGTPPSNSLASQTPASTSAAASGHHTRSIGGSGSAFNSPAGTPLLRPQQQLPSNAILPGHRDSLSKKPSQGNIGAREGCVNKPMVRNIGGRRVLERPNLTLPVPVNINRAYIADIDGDGLNELVLARTDRILHSYALQATKAQSPTASGTQPNNQPLNLVKLLSCTSSISTLDSSGLLSPSDERRETVIHYPSLSSLGRHYYATGTCASQSGAEPVDINDPTTRLSLTEKKRWALDGQVHCLSVTKDAQTGLPILLVAQPGLKFVMIDHAGNMSESLTQAQRNHKPSLNVSGPDTPTRSAGSGDVATDIVCGTHYVNGQKKDIIGLMSMDGVFALHDLESNTVRVHDLDSTHKIFGFSKLNFSQGDGQSHHHQRPQARSRPGFRRSSRSHYADDEHLDDDDDDDFGDIDDDVDPIDINFDEEENNINHRNDSGDGNAYVGEDLDSGDNGDDDDTVVIERHILEDGSNVECEYGSSLRQENTSQRRRRSRRHPSRQHDDYIQGSSEPCGITLTCPASSLDSSARVQPRRRPKRKGPSLLISEPYGSRFQKNDMFVGCSWSGATFFIDQDFNTAEYDFEARVCAFGAGQYAVTPGKNEPCLFYVDFEDNIYVYYNLYIQTAPTVPFQEVVKTDANLVRTSRKIYLSDKKQCEDNQQKEASSTTETANVSTLEDATATLTMNTSTVQEGDSTSAEEESSKNDTDTQIPSHPDDLGASSVATLWMERDMKDFIHDSLYNANRYEDEYQRLRRLADYERAKKVAFYEAEARREREQEEKQERERLAAERARVVAAAAAAAAAASAEAEGVDSPPAKSPLAFIDPLDMRSPKGALSDGAITSKNTRSDVNDNEENNSVGSLPELSRHSLTGTTRPGRDKIAQRGRFSAHDLTTNFESSSPPRLHYSARSHGSAAGSGSSASPFPNRFSRRGSGSPSGITSGNDAQSLSPMSPLSPTTPSLPKSKRTLEAGSSGSAGDSTHRSGKGGSLRERRRSSLLIKDVLANYDASMAYAEHPAPLKSPTSPTSSSSSLLTAQQMTGQQSGIASSSASASAGGQSASSTALNSIMKRFSFKDIGNGGRLSRVTNASSGTGGNASGGGASQALATAQSLGFHGAALLGKGKALDNRVGKGVGVSGRRLGMKSRLSQQQDREDESDEGEELEGVEEEGHKESSFVPGEGRSFEADDESNAGTDGDHLLDFESASRKSIGDGDEAQLGLGLCPVQEFDLDPVSEEFFRGVEEHACQEDENEGGENDMVGVYTPSTISPIPSPGRLSGNQAGAEAEPSPSLDSSAFVFARNLLLSPLHRGGGGGGAVSVPVMNTTSVLSAVAPPRTHTRRKSAFGLLEIGMGFLPSSTPREVVSASTSSLPPPPQAHGLSTATSAPTSTMATATTSGSSSQLGSPLPPPLVPPTLTGHSMGPTPDGRRSRAESVLSTGSDIGGIIVPDITLLASSFPGTSPAHPTSGPSISRDETVDTLEEEGAIDEDDRGDHRQGRADALRRKDDTQESLAMAASQSFNRHPPRRSATLDSQDSARGSGSGSDTGTGKGNHTIGIRRRGSSGQIVSGSAQTAEGGGVGNANTSANTSGDVRLMPAPLPRSTQHHHRQQQYLVQHQQQQQQQPRHHRQSSSGSITGQSDARDGGNSPASSHISFTANTRSSETYSHLHHAPPTLLRENSNSGFASLSRLAGSGGSMSGGMGGGGGASGSGLIGVGGIVVGGKSSSTTSSATVSEFGGSGPSSPLASNITATNPILSNTLVSGIRGDAHGSQQLQSTTMTSSNSGGGGGGGAIAQFHVHAQAHMVEDDRASIRSRTSTYHEDVSGSHGRSAAGSASGIFGIIQTNNAPSISQQPLPPTNTISDSLVKRLEELQQHDQELIERRQREKEREKEKKEPQEQRSKSTMATAAAAAAVVAGGILRPSALSRANSGASVHSSFSYRSGFGGGGGGQQQPSSTSQVPISQGSTTSSGAGKSPGGGSAPASGSSLAMKDRHQSIQEH